MQAFQRSSFWVMGVLGLFASITLCFTLLSIPASAAVVESDCDPATERFSPGGIANPPACINNNDNPRNADDCLDGFRFAQPTIGPAQCINNAENPRGPEDCQNGSTYREPGTNGVTDPGGCTPIPAGCPGSTLQGPANPDIECPPLAGEDTENVQCTTESGLSWLICPAIEIALNGAKVVADTIDGLLEVPPLEIGGSSAAAYGVWSNLRNLANVLLIFVLFGIIYSQAASMGISAYGIKRIVPRLIAGAILINLSYFLCAIAIDIFNVIGFGIRDLVVGTLSVPQGGENPPIQGDPNNLLSSVVGSIGTAVAVVGAAAAIVIAIWLFGSLILLALLIALVTLAARQALIILMVILSPIAIAAWILPNTEKLFDKWKDLFIGLLAMFPMVMLLFSGSHVAATVMAASAGRNGAIEEGLILILVILVAISPVAATPLLLKAGLFSMQRISALARNAGGSVSKRYGETGFGQDRKQQKAAKDRAVAAGNYSGKDPRRKAKSVFNRALNRSSMFNNRTGGYGARRELTDARDRASEREGATKVFRDNPDLAKAWIGTSGEFKDDAARQAAKDKYGISSAGIESLEKMRRGKQNESAESYIAAQEMLVASGRGDEKTLASTIAKINDLSPGSKTQDAEDIAEKSRATWRSTGRGDLVGMVDGNKDRQTSFAAKWEDVSAASISRFAFDGGQSGGHANRVVQPDGSVKTEYSGNVSGSKSFGEDSFRSYLAGADVKDASKRAGEVDTRRASYLSALNSMEGRARKEVERVLVETGNNRSIEQQKADAGLSFRGAPSGPGGGTPPASTPPPGPPPGSTTTSGAFGPRPGPPPTPPPGSGSNP